MSKTNYSLLELLFPQLVRTDLYLHLGSKNIQDNYWDMVEHFPTFSTAFSDLITEEIVRYANEISTETIKSKNTENSSIFRIVDALTNEPTTQEEYEFFDGHIKELAQDKVDITVENQSNVDLSIVRKYAKLLVEIDDFLTCNVRSISLEQTIPRLTLLTNILKSNRIVDPEVYKQNYHRSIDYLRKVAARYNKVKIPEGYRKIETTNIGEKYSLPDYFEIIGENQKIPIFDNGTKILNPKLFERKIIIEMNPNGEFPISPIYERPLRYVPEQYHRQFRILQNGNFIEYLIKTPEFNAKSYGIMLYYFLKEEGLDRPGNLEISEDALTFYWRHEERGSFFAQRNY